MLFSTQFRNEFNEYQWSPIDKEEKKYGIRTEQQMEKIMEEVDRDEENEELKDAPKNDMYVIIIIITYFCLFSTKPNSLCIMTLYHSSIHYL